MGNAQQTMDIDWSQLLTEHFVYQRVLFLVRIPSAAAAAAAA